MLNKTYDQLIKYDVLLQIKGHAQVLAVVVAAYTCSGVVHSYARSEVTKLHVLAKMILTKLKG